MARPRKSEAEKRAAGNPGRREILPDPELEILTDATPPDWMSEEQGKYWQRYAGMLIASKRFTVACLSALEDICFFEAEADDIRKKISKGELPTWQEKKNYHGEVVDIVCSTPRKTMLDDIELAEKLKAYLGIRPDKMHFKVKVDKKSKFEGLIGGAKD